MLTITDKPTKMVDARNAGDKMEAKLSSDPTHWRLSCKLPSSSHFLPYHRVIQRQTVLRYEKDKSRRDEKAKILAEAGLVTIPEPKAAPVEDAAEEASGDSGEDNSEEATEE